MTLSTLSIGKTTNNLRNLWVGIKERLARDPDVVIGPLADPYLHRWHIIPRNPVFNVYLHHFFRSDDDRALHDHPWVNLSILLKGHYDEHVPGAIIRRGRGSIIARGARSRHRIALIEGARVWTLFLTGPRLRKWGFHCPEGWVAFDDFEKQGGCEGMNNAFEIPVRKAHSEKDFYGFGKRR